MDVACCLYVHHQTSIAMQKTCDTRINNYASIADNATSIIILKKTDKPNAAYVV
jgi:hypothetical protein